MRKKFTIVVCVLVLILAAVLLWPTAGYDIVRVHRSLRELKTPYQSVTTGFYLDGGSIGITIVDRDSRRLELALPVSAEHGKSYPRLFAGAKHISKTGAVEIAFSDDTRQMLISVLEQYGRPTDGSDIALVELRGWPRDYARIGSRAASRYCQSLWK